MQNVLANWISHAVILIVNFFLTPLVVNYLGPSGYGIWALVVTLTGYLGLLDLGVRSTVTRFVARSQGGADVGTAVRSVSAALALFGGAAIVAVLASVALGAALPTLFDVPSEYRATVVIVTALVGASTATALVTGVFGGVIVGMQRYDLARALETGTVLLRAALVVVVLASHGGLVALAAVQLGAAVAGGVLTAWVSRRLYPALSFRPEWDVRHLRLMFGYGGYTFTAHLGSALLERSGVIVIGAVLPMTAVTVFAIASALIDQVRALAGGIRMTLSPLASVFEARGERHQLRKLVLDGARYSTIVVVPIAATFAIRGSSFIALWLGPEYGAPSGAVLAILALRLTFATPTGAVANVMLGAGRQRAVAAVVLAEALIGLAAITLLVQPWGVAGVAWGLTAPAVVTALAVWPRYVRHDFGADVRQYVTSSWVRPVVAASPFIGATWLVERMWPAASLTLFFGQTAALVPLALGGFWHVCLSDAERRRYLGMLGLRRRQA